VEKIPDGVIFTFIADSCNSGGLIQHLEERIGSGQPRNVSKSLATSAGLEQLGKLYWEWIPAASWSSINWKMA
jgi:hypothetical protein